MNKSDQPNDENKQKSVGMTLTPSFRSDFIVCIYRVIYTCTVTVAQIVFIYLLCRLYLCGWTHSEKQNEARILLHMAAAIAAATSHGARKR